MPDKDQHTRPEAELARIREAYCRRIESGAVDRYSLFVPGELYMLQRREAAMLELLRGLGLKESRGMKVLEVGCGRGLRLLDWARWGALPDDLFGVDLMEPFIRQASRNFPGAGFAVASGDLLPFVGESFDIVVQLTVFTSILDPGLKHAVAREMLRVVRARGVIVWYDFRYANPRNPDVAPIGRREIRDLFPGCRIKLRSVTLAPPLARRLAPVSFCLCRALESLPPLRTHYLAGIRKV